MFIDRLFAADGLLSVIGDRWSLRRGVSPRITTVAGISEIGRISSSVGCCSNFWRVWQYFVVADRSHCGEVVDTLADGPWDLNSDGRGLANETTPTCTGVSVHGESFRSSSQQASTGPDTIAFSRANPSRVATVRLTSSQPTIWSTTRRTDGISTPAEVGEDGPYLPGCDEPEP